MTGMDAIRSGGLMGLPNISAGEPRRSDLSALREDKGVLEIDAEVADRALDLRVVEQDLHRAQVAGWPRNRSKHDGAGDVVRFDA